MRIFVLIALLGCNCLLQGQETTMMKPRPEFGLSGGFYSGDLKVNNLDKLYGDFESISGPAYGAFMRFAPGKNVFLRVEYLYSTRLLKGYYSDVFISTYPIELRQKVNDVSLVVQYQPFRKLHTFAPYIGLGLGIGFLSPDSQHIEEVTQGILLAPLDFKVNSDDTNGIGELGFRWQLTRRLSLHISGRYYLTGNSFNFNIPPERADSKSVTFTRITGLGSIGYSF